MNMLQTLFIQIVSFMGRREEKEKKEKAAFFSMEPAAYRLNTCVETVV